MVTGATEITERHTPILRGEGMHEFRLLKRVLCALAAAVVPVACSSSRKTSSSSPTTSGSPSTSQASTGSASQASTGSASQASSSAAAAPVAGVASGRR